MFGVAVLHQDAERKCGGRVGLDGGPKPGTTSRVYRTNDPGVPPPPPRTSPLTLVYSMVYSSLPEYCSPYLGVKLPCNFEHFPGQREV